MRNAETFVVEAIASVLQERTVPIELIVLDDGSEDRSRKVVESLRDPRIVLLDGPRRGISACMNVGLAEFSGDIVMRCDADDLYPAGRIARQVAWLERHPSHIAVSGPLSTIAADGKLIAHLWAHGAQDCSDISAELVQGIARTSLCTYAIRRAALARVGTFREYFETAGDIDFALRLGSIGPIGYVVGETYRYRLHDASVTHTQHDIRRLFFQQAASTFARERAATGSDALMRHEAPQPPSVSDGSVTRAAAQAQGILVGEAWRVLSLGDRLGALRLSWRAIWALPTTVDSWKQMAKIVWRCVVPASHRHGDRRS